MIKLMFCLRRLPSLSPEAFSDHWLNRHAPLVRSLAADLNIRRYVQSHSRKPETALGLMQVRGSQGQYFDGVAELWWDDWQSFSAPAATQAGRAANTVLLEDEQRFIDLPNSPIFLSREHVIVS